MRNLTCHMKRLAILPALAATMILSACGGGIDLQGPGFETLGLTSKKHVEKKVPDRAPLLIPPDRTRLPQPGVASAAPPQNWPRDPGDLLKRDELRAEKENKEYENKGDWSKNADIDEFEKAVDPIERQPGVFSKNKVLSKKYREKNNYPR